jgi:transposase
MLYAGVDLQRKTSQVAVLQQQGKLLFNRHVRSDREELLRIFGEAGPSDSLQVAFEATYGWGWFADLLEDVGIPAHMAHPRANKAIASARVKNDAVDAKTLAQLLRTGLLPQAWIAPPETRDARRLVRMRTAMVRIRSRLKNQVHALLADRGLHAEGSDIFAGDLSRLTKLLPVVARQRAEANLRLIQELDKEVDLADAQIHKLFAGDERVRRLLPIPGVGVITAAIVVAEVGDIERFQTARQFCSWCGLTPTEQSSADNIRRGHISKQGSRWLRWILVEAAVHAFRNHDLSKWEAAIANRRGGKIARVALARRIATLCFHALRSPRGCRAFPARTR